MPQTLIKSRDPQKLQIATLCDAVLNRAKLGLMKLIERLSAPNQYADEEVESNYGYLYRLKSIAKQATRLRELFPGIGCANEKLAEQPLPAGAEGYFAIPRWEKVGKTYPEAVQLALDAIRKTRGGRFYNHRHGQIDDRHIYQSTKTAEMLGRLGAEQDSEILVVPAQFGLLHRGRSARRAGKVMNSSEFGLGAFQVSMMLLTHPERLQRYEELWIDCAGDEFSNKGDGLFEGVPFFYFRGGVKFAAGWCGVADAGCGSVSAFLPQ